MPGPLRSVAASRTPTTPRSSSDPHQVLLCPCLSTGASQARQSQQPQGSSLVKQKNGQNSFRGKLVSAASVQKNCASQLEDLHPVCILALFFLWFEVSNEYEK
ncbi:hypothetical protein U9M48_030443 [Paspalum notatum var. saurae]|uniref:Uncharacterized protein n=1 Tax=Paspalum notatum var. saurae TaxID=547442 RepID=A0AAQ3X2L4_PASNO